MHTLARTWLCTPTNTSGHMYGHDDMMTLVGNMYSTNFPCIPHACASQHKHAHVRVCGCVRAQTHADRCGGDDDDD